MTKSTSSIPVLERNNVTAIKNSDKATMLNQYFSECFNSLYTIRKILSFFSFPGMITSVFMSLLLDISYLKRISM